MIVEKLELRCVNPTKTITKWKTYTGYPAKKGDDDGSYNGMWTRGWEYCESSKATSYKVVDDIGIVRYFAKRRFEIITD